MAADFASINQAFAAKQSPNCEAFQYPTLPAIGWIRLLQILPGSGVLNCRLTVAQLDDPEISFDALSYVWGEDTQSYCVEMICEGQAFTIGKNLARALERIRDREAGRFIWADAICINQCDVDERSSQVQQMAEIYMQARRVLIWAGESPEDESEACFGLIKRVNRLSKRLLAQYRTVESIPTASYEHHVCSISSDAWGSIRRLMNSSWFTRVWVIQEVGLSRSAQLMYGNSEMDWVELVEFMLFVADRPDLAAYVGDVRAGMIWDVFDDIWRTFNNTESWRHELSHMEFLPEVPPGKSFLDIANVIRPYDATDPRDRIYGLLGHPTALHRGLGNAKILEVDYSKSVAEVYTELATYTIAHDQFPWMTLTCVDHSDGLPALAGQRLSWVPWWNEGWRVYWLGYSAMWYRAGGLNPDKFQARVSADNSLHLNAILFDRIAWISEPVNSSLLMADRRPFADPIAELWTALRKEGSLSRYGNSQESEIAFSLVVAAGRARDEGPAEDDLSLHMSIYESSRSTESGNSAMNDENAIRRRRTADIQVSTYYRNQARALHNRRLFRTSTGYYGICHFSVKVDDVCCVVPGANVPFVLRRVSQNVQGPRGAGYYHLVGEAYIQGIMRGELLTAMSDTNDESNALPEQVITIW